MVPAGSVLLALSFALRGAPMWTVAVAGALLLGFAYPAMAVYRGELFPTHQRGLAGGLIMTSSLVGGSIGLIGAGRAVDAGATYGDVMLLLAVFPVLASVVVWWRYPETAHRTLEELNPEDAPASPTT
jgi:MFS family permease